MRIGIDLDNTIICYDALFHKVALEHSWIPASTPVKKNEVKDAIFRNYNNALWTQLQGIVYGERLSEARPYPAALEFFIKCRNRGYSTCIISHKTQYPAVGSRQDLRKAALNWLSTQGWLDEQFTGLRLQDIEFTDTREAKVGAITQKNCEAFIDDLPEVFQEANFPHHIKRYLFDPDNHHFDWVEGTRVNSWLKLQKVILS